MVDDVSTVCIMNKTIMVEKIPDIKMRGGVIKESTLCKS